MNRKIGPCVYPKLPRFISSALFCDQECPRYKNCIVPVGKTRYYLCPIQEQIIRTMIPNFIVDMQPKFMPYTGNK